jgi:hypothetical protein
MMPRYRVKRINGKKRIVDTTPTKRKINPRNRPGPNPRDPVKAFEKEVKRASTLVTLIEDEPFTAADRRYEPDPVLLAIQKRNSELSARERQRLAYELRNRGHSYNIIAEVLGYASKSGACNAVTRVRQEIEAATRL